MGFGRRRGGEDAGDNPSTASGSQEPRAAAERSPRPEPDTPLLSTFIPRSLSEGRRPSSSPVGAEAVLEDDASDASQTYRELGARVASVLASAEQAAAKIRVDAKQEASGILDEAGDIRAAAHRDADEKRQEAEAEAARIRAAAESDAQSIVEEARGRASADEKAARRRTASIEKEAQRAVERLQKILTATHAVAKNVEEALAARENDVVQRPPEPTDASLDDDLKPQPRSAR